VNIAYTDGSLVGTVLVAVGGPWMDGGYSSAMTSGSSTVYIDRKSGRQ